MYKKSIKGWLKHLDFLILDLIFLHLGLLAAFILTWNEGNPYLNPRFTRIALVFLLCQLIVIFFNQSFSNVLKRSNVSEILESLKHTILIIVVFLIALFIIHEQHMISRTFMILLFVFCFVIGFLARYCYKKILLRRFHLKAPRRSMLLLTSETIVDEVVSELTSSDLFDFFLKGIILVDRNVKQEEHIQGIPVMQSTDDIMNRISHEWVDELFIYLPEGMKLSEDVMEELSGMGMPMHTCVADLNKGYGEQHVDTIGGYAVVTRGVKMVSTGQLFAKRLLDILGGLVGCLATLIIMAIIGPMIKKADPGPIFFSQVRIGQNGKPFKIYKFRSMYMDAEARKEALLSQSDVDDIMFKLKDDPRIIGSEKKDADGNPKGIGNFIRKTSLDEFPQFLNVLKGDMSLVGTRPPTVDEWNRYGTQHRVRMVIKPGITGLWQVSGRSEIENFDEVVKLDRQYIQNWSVGFDIKILLRTVKVVLKGEGAV